MKVVDLFAGCGGMSLGFEKQGFEVVGAFEWWDTAVKCYQENFSHPIYQMDLSDTKTAAELISKLKPDMIIGGPPCQDFSHAGKRVESNRAELTESYASIIADIKPYCFVMENVDRARNSHAYSVARSIFKEAGYGLTEIALDASLCGVPQKRKRFICFGMLGEKDGFADKIFADKMAKKPLTMRDYFGDKLDFEYYYRHPRNYSRRAVFSIDEPAPTIRGVSRPIPNGYHGHPNDACPIEQVKHSLTTKERALIQTFPEDYKWVGNKTDMEQMIGNAVPVNLAQFVAEVVNESLGEKEIGRNRAV